jgi:tRNA A37 threonylcarbamoyladenosine dehydratase
MLPERATRTEALIGADAVSRLRGATVLLIGLGGVGGYALEALARGGIGTLWIADSDRIAESNCNRQILALTETVGKEKTEVACCRVRSIAPDAAVHAMSEFIDAGNIGALITRAKPDYIIDAIDTVASKLAIIEAARESGVPVISCMGTGNHLDPAAFVIGDISKSTVCPLARVMRTELRKRKITGVTALWSTEKPLSASAKEENGRHTPASISYTPGIAGLMLAGHVIRALIKDPADEGR